MSETATGQEITIKRVYDAPRELVWKAWTEPDQLAAWWGPEGWSTDAADVTMELRPGGAFRVLSTFEDGSRMPVEGVYREVVEFERLVLDEPSRGNWHEGSTSVMTLTDLGDGRTELQLRATIHTTPEMATGAERGMRGTLDRLAAHLGG